MEQNNENFVLSKDRRDQRQTKAYNELEKILIGKSTMNPADWVKKYSYKFKEYIDRNPHLLELFYFNRAEAEKLVLAEFNENK